jgi:hypothetical protein
MRLTVVLMTAIFVLALGSAVQADPEPRPRTEQVYLQVEGLG